MQPSKTPESEKKLENKSVMSGMRPTGRLHLGHYIGVLKNWIHLQELYDCYFMIADWHALTTQYEETSQLQENIVEMAVDWLAVGLDPQKATIYVQSSIPEIAELHLLLGMLTPNKWVETDPTLKDMVQMLHEDLTYGLLGYPVLQTSDILVMRGELVPVGKDQLAHLEISRDIARRFNHCYRTELFKEPQPLLTETPLLIGLDGRKMGKSYGNGIFLSDTEDEVWSKVKTAVTDPARIRRSDPGNPEACEVVFPYYQIFADSDAITAAAEECRTAKRGCMDCKKILNEAVMETLRPIRERRKLFEGDRAQVLALLAEGQEKARANASETLRLVRTAMKLFHSASTRSRCLSS